jgi:hypothetical protein
MPAPFDARFPEGPIRAPLVLIAQDSDWGSARGKWVFVRATMQGSPARNSIRDGNLYKRAVDAGAVGLIFSLPMKPGRWRAVAPIDKAYALRDEAYPDKRRPMHCYCVDPQDGELLEHALETLGHLAHAADAEGAEPEDIADALPARGEGGTP